MVCQTRFRLVLFNCEVESMAQSPVQAEMEAMQAQADVCKGVTERITSLGARAGATITSQPRANSKVLAEG